jgi:deazaflavin-dependent oxidoreductase (nitroreductase family)
MDGNKVIIEEFRANKGKVGGHFQNATLLLLHTVGSKSGKKRINPMMTIQEGDQYIVVASKGGAPTNPDWYYNLVANPEVSLEFGTEIFDAVAKETTDPERSELYAKMSEKYPFFDEYARNTDRVIPLILLTRK